MKNPTKRINKLYSILLALFTGFFLACSTRSAEQEKHYPSDIEIKAKRNSLENHLEAGKYYAVKKIVDGDTFWLDDGSEKGVKIRFIGIDAPESRNAFNKKKQVYGDESKAYLSTLLEGQQVRLEFDVQPFDRFERTLAYVYLRNGDMVNELIVKTGNGILMTIAPNVKYQDKFIKAQEKARNQKLGLWGVELTR